MATSTTAPQIITEKLGRAGIITLNRPKALNALTLDMVRGMTSILEQWKTDDDVALVIVRGAGERGLCAGGDIAMLYRDAKAGGTEGETFWKEEYALNQMIANYPKPYVALMSGLVLGGGVGISAHSSHRVVTDSTRIGMPETGIGFLPDVGGTYLLAHAPDNLGYHLAYTALHVGAAEALDLGLADYYVPEASIDQLVTALVKTGTADAITAFTADAGESFPNSRDSMVDAYSDPAVEVVVEKLEQRVADHGDQDWAAKALKRIRGNSPLSIKAAERAIANAKHMTLAQALDQEFTVGTALHGRPDFQEGVRAQIIDKDFTPTWEHADFSAVPQPEIDAIFSATKRR